MNIKPLLTSAALLTGCTLPVTETPTLIKKTEQLVYKEIATITQQPDGGCMGNYPGGGIIKPLDMFHSIPLPTRARTEDHAPFAGLHPTIGLRVGPYTSGVTPEPDPQILAQDARQCADGKESCTIFKNRSLDEYKRFALNPPQDLAKLDVPVHGSGAIIKTFQHMQKQYGVVLTAGHVFIQTWNEKITTPEKVEESFDKDIALFTTELSEPSWQKKPVVDVDMESTYEDLLGQDAEMHVRFSGCDFNDDVRVLRFRLLGTNDKSFFLGMASKDASSFFGSVSGAPVYHKGKVIGIFTGLTGGTPTYMRIVPITTVQEVVKRNQKNIEEGKLFRDIWPE